MTTLMKLGQITRALDASLATLAKRPDVALEVGRYRERIESIRSLDDFLKDDRVLRFAMKAFGLEDLAYAKGLMRRVLSEGIDAPDALANRLADRRYREFAEAFNFQRYGESATVFDRARQGTIDRYLRQSLEEDEGAQNENVRLALYFQRKAAGIEGPFDILADRALTQFAFVALGLPASTSVLDIDRQAELLRQGLDFDGLKSPERLAQLMTRFAARADAAAPAASTGAELLLSGRAGAGLSADLLLAVQRSRIR